MLLHCPNIVDGTPKPGRLRDNELTVVNRLWNFLNRADSGNSPARAGLVAVEMSKYATFLAKAVGIVVVARSSQDRGGLNTSSTLANSAARSTAASKSNCLPLVRLIECGFKRTHFGIHSRYPQLGDFPDSHGFDRRGPKFLLRSLLDLARALFGQSRTPLQQCWSHMTYFRAGSRGEGYGRNVGGYVW